MFLVVNLAFILASFVYLFDLVLFCCIGAVSLEKMKLERKR